MAQVCPCKREAVAHRRVATLQPDIGTGDKAGVEKDGDREGDVVEDGKEDDLEDPGRRHLRQQTGEEYRNNERHDHDQSGDCGEDREDEQFPVLFQNREGRSDERDAAPESSSHVHRFDGRK